MSEKVKVSQDVADVIEKHLKRGMSNGSLIIDYVGWRLENAFLSQITLDDLIKALYIGYEVEPEFKENDWVIRTVELGRHHEEGRIFQVQEVLDQEVFENEVITHEQSSIRYATESEIAQEKERRFFARHGRKPWELRKGDVLQNKHTGMQQIRVVTVIDGGEPVFGLYETGIDYKRNFHVVCFAEDRLDY